MEGDTKGKETSEQSSEGLLLEEPKDCTPEGEGQEGSDLEWFTDHDEKGLWIMEIFQYRCGRVRTLRTYRSNKLSELIEHGQKVCDEIETFFRLRPDDAVMEQKVKERNWAYQKPKDCFEHGPHHGECQECKDDERVVSEVAREIKE